MNINYLNTFHSVKETIKKNILHFRRTFSRYLENRFRFLNNSCIQKKKNPSPSTLFWHTGCDRKWMIIKIEGKMYSIGIRSDDDACVNLLNRSEMPPVPSLVPVSFREVKGILFFCHFLKSSSSSPNHIMPWSSKPIATETVLSSYWSSVTVTKRKKNWGVVPMAANSSLVTFFKVLAVTVAENLQFKEFKRRQVQTWSESWQLGVQRSNQWGFSRTM